MNSAIILAVFGMLAVANAGLIGAPAVGLAYAGYPAYGYNYGYAAAPVAYAAAAPVAYAAVPATIHTRTYHGNGAPVVGPAPVVFSG